MKKRNRTARGFSLIEVLITMGILGVIGYFLTGVLKTGSMGQKTLLAQDDARVLTENMASLLSSKAACEYTFGDGAPEGSPTLSPAANANVTGGDGGSVTKLYDSSMKVQFQVGQTYGNRGLKLSKVTIGGSGVDGKTNIQKWITQSPTTGMAFVQVDWEQTGAAGSGMGPAHLLRYFMVYVAQLNSSNPNAVATCVAQVGAATVGISPVGGIIAWHKSMSGTPSLPDGWAECNGQVLHDTNSPYDGQTMPALNSDTQDGTTASGMFLRGASTSGATQAGGTAVNNLTADSPDSRYGGPGVGTLSGGWGYAVTGTVRVRLQSTDKETRPANMSVVWIMRVH